MMLGGMLCGLCGEALDCDECADMGIPMYCSDDCAESGGASSDQVCDHE